MRNFIARFRVALSTKPLTAIGALFLSVTIGWLVVFSHSAAFAGTHTVSQAQLCVQQAQSAWRHGEPKNADRLFEKAYQLYASAGYSVDDLSEICFSRAHINSSLGNEVLACQLRQQGDQLKKVEQR